MENKLSKENLEKVSGGFIRPGRIGMSENAICYGDLNSQLKACTGTVISPERCTRCTCVMNCHIMKDDDE